VEYSFAHEHYETVVNELKTLTIEHWQELALNRDKIKLDPDWEMYRIQDERGVCVCYTVRVGEEKTLVGYAIYFIKPHHHYKSTKWAMNDIVFVKKEHRNVGVGNGLLEFIEKDLKAKGVKMLNTMVKLGHPALGFLLTARGHTKVEEIYSKVL
jgi:GNAT superfamily N-acetyltransferase